jgi:hypothetical protein
MILGCGGGLTIGPVTKTEYVVVYPGRPLQVLENRTLKVRYLGDESLGKQDIGGWVAMPREHFDKLAEMAGLERKAP